VLVYTSAELIHDMEVIGPVTADLYVRSSLQHTDFFARLCVVEESGKSINLCDGILRLTPGSVTPECVDLAVVVPYKYARMTTNPGTTSARSTRSWGGQLAW